jgi:hypothetical protein
MTQEEGTLGLGGVAADAGAVGGAGVAQAAEVVTAEEEAGRAVAPAVEHCA